MIAGGTAAGFLAERVGWRPSFLILGGIGVALAAVAMVWLRDPRTSSLRAASTEPIRATIFALTRTPAYGIILVEAGLIALSTWIFINWLPLYFREAYQLTLAAAGFSGTFSLTAGATVGVLTGGYLSDKIARGDPRRRLLILGVFYALAAPLLLMFLMRPPVGILGFAILTHGFLRALGSANELPILCELLPSHRRGTAMGLMNAMNTFIGGSGVFISGLLMSHVGLKQIFIGLTGVVFLAAAISLIGYRWVLPRDRARKQHAGA